MRKTNIIMLASQNKGKTEEFRELFGKYPEYEFKSLGEIVWNTTAIEKVENGTTYYENAFNKGRVAHFAAKVPTIGDDSGLEVDALNGKPGVFSDRFAEVRAGYTKDESNRQKLLEELQGVAKDKRTARFVCTLTFFLEGIVLSTTDTLEGTILEAPRGTKGFGYDPIFLVKGTDKSLAEMSMEEKNQLSHRAKAFDKLITLIKEKNIQLVRP